MTNDVRGMREALENFHDTIEIEELLDERATREAILDRFRDLVARSIEAPCLFFFAGPGNHTGEPALVAFQDRRGQPCEIMVRELSELAGPQAKNLVCIIDAGWIPSTKLPWTTPCLNRCESALRHEVMAADWVVPTDLSRAMARLSAPAQRYLALLASEGVCADAAAAQSLALTPDAFQRMIEKVEAALREL